MPVNSGSLCNIRVRIPSVSTSIRVEVEVFCWPRIRYPSVSPAASFRLWAIRSAAARAARRRGSNTIIRPLILPDANKASGTMVVLPAPGGAVKISLELRSIAPRSSGITFVIGKAGSGLNLTTLKGRRSTQCAEAEFCNPIASVNGLVIYVKRECGSIRQFLFGKSA